jgi:hypothetical protein
MDSPLVTDGEFLLYPLRGSAVQRTFERLGDGRRDRFLNLSISHLRKLRQFARFDLLDLTEQCCALDEAGDHCS